jgi:hypothetical protein
MGKGEKVKGKLQHTYLLKFISYWLFLEASHLVREP